MTKVSPPEFELHMGRGWLTSETALALRPANRNDANGYYRALGLSPDATREEIKSAHRRLAKKLHPDHGGDEELFRFVSDIAEVLLNQKSKAIYDSVGDNAVFLGRMEREELSRLGMLKPSEDSPGAVCEPHWACLTTLGFLPGSDTDRWAELCREVSAAVGYRGKIQVGVLEDWPGGTWGVLSAGSYTFVIFQRGVEPNRLIAYCAMNDLNKREWAQAQEERKSWL